jgi:hypothetical protein
MSPSKIKDASRPALPSLSAKDVKKLLHLVRNSKSVEIKVSVPMTAHQRTTLSIGLDPVESEPRHVYFLDTANQTLNRAGIIVRARRMRGGTADTVIKLRPIDPATIDDELRRSGAFKIEVDAMPDGTFMCSGSYKGDATGQEVLDAIDGTRKIRSLFSKAQRAFFDAHAPAGTDLNSLSIFGPILTLRAKHRPKEFPRGVTAELWLWQDGKHILELSTKSAPAEGFQAGVEFRAYLEEHGVDLSARQETKTRTAMKKFLAGGPLRRGAGRSGSATRS